MDNTPSTLGGWVASRRRHPKLIKYYTDAHDVDEDMRTISLQGGRWSESMTGFARRSMVDTSTATWYTVAYKDKNTTLSARMVFLMI